MYLYVATV